MTTRIRLLACAGLLGCAALVASLSQPAATAAYSTIGGNLGTSQRDFRVWNNFVDSQANNNTTPHASFPGQTGAVMAIWKAHVEWGSEPYAGTGLGDGAASNPVLGSGGANFDNTFQGTATSAGTTNQNIHSELAGSSGGVLAFTETPISDGWRILYYSSWTWQDGPGEVATNIDLQGVACHEIGHSLGLGHSADTAATMYWALVSGTGTAQRSINADDIEGVQFIYGAAASTKPRIFSLSGSLQIGAALTINGTNFSSTGNEVWFTKVNGDGNPVKVTGVASSAGGTVISVTIPAGITDGDVLVKTSGSGHASLSNAWPLDLGGSTADVPVLASVLPTSGPAGGFTQVTLAGTGLSGAAAVTFDGVPALNFQVVNGTTMTATTPGGPLGAKADITVTDSEGSSTLTDAFTWTANPAPNIGSVFPFTGSIHGGTEVTVYGSSVVGVTSVTFGGVPGTALDVVSATEINVVTPPHAAGPVNVVAIGNGSDTVVNAFSFVDMGQFVDLGPGKPGSAGTPTLTGAGDLSAGSTTGLTLTLTGAVPLQTALLYVSLTALPVPFKGGTFYPVPILTALPFPTDGLGQVVVGTALPPGFPTLSFVLQYWCMDPGATFGLSASNGLQCDMP
jgi:hypothetical protein